MEVTRELRKEKLTKKGLAPIQLTFYWEGKRLRLASGEKCQPEHWNPKTSLVRDKPGAYADQRNLVLQHWTEAGHNAHRDAAVRGRQLSEKLMETEIRRRYQLLAGTTDTQPAAPGLPLLDAPAPDLLATMQQWIDHQQSKVSLRSGKPLEKKTISALQRTRRELEEFSRQTRYPLTFSGISHEFYAKFQRYVLSTRGHSVNTLSAHVKRLKAFLHWSEQQDIIVNRHYQDFEAPERYKGVEALTEQELLRLAAVDLSTPQVRAYVAQHFPLAERAHAGGREMLTHEDHFQRLQYARDKVLLCCYLGLRLGDADRLAPEHLAGEVVRIHANKTGALCVIPYFDDDVFKPVELIGQYAPLGLETCLPYVREIYDYLPHVQHLAGLRRIPLSTRLGRKTFATLKIYQGIPKAQVMLATGHTTEKSFNRYLGIDEQELVEAYRKTARRVA